MANLGQEQTTQGAPEQFVPAPAAPPQTNPLSGLTNEQIEAVRLLFATTHHPKKHDVPLKAPEPFEGDPKKARNFLNDCDLQFAVNPHKFEGDDTDRLKVGYILFFCTKGAARDFAELCFAQYKATGIWDSYTKFVEKFKSQFITTDEAGTALQNLTRLHMKDFRNADEYASRFRILASQAEIYDDAMLGYHFTQGLTNELKDYLVDKGIPKDFDELVKSIQGRYARGELMKSLASRAPPAVTRHDPDVMDIDAINLSPNERDRRSRLGLCFTCGVKGYLTAQCPEKKRWSTAKTQQNNRWPRDNTGRFLPRTNNGFQNRNFQSR